MSLGRSQYRSRREKSRRYSQPSTLSNQRIVQHILHQRLVIIRSNLLLNRIQRIDHISHASSSGAATDGQHTKIVADLAEIRVAAEVQAHSDVSSIIAKDADVLRCFQWQSIVLVFEQDDTSGTKLADERCVIIANVDVGGTEVEGVVVRF